MRKSLYILALAVILLALCGCASTSSEDYDGIWYYGHYRGSAYSAAKSSFHPTQVDVVSVYCRNTDFTLRRSLEEAVAEAFEAEGIKCMKFSDYSAGRMIEDLSDEEYDDILWQEWLDGVKYYINIAIGDRSTYTLGGGLADAAFEFSINTYGTVLSGSLFIEETSGNQSRESYLTSLGKVSKLAGILVAKEYLEYCPKALELEAY